MKTLNCGIFGELTDEQITAVMQLTFQLIASANCGGISEADDPSIDVMMQKMDFSGPLLSTIGDAYWNDAMDMSPYAAFNIVSNFTESKKVAFKNTILAVARKANTTLRMDIAMQIFSRTGISF